MFQKIKLYEVDPDNTFFVSDLHHGHNPLHWETPIWKQRGFESGAACDEGLIVEWNKRCNDKSVVFNLGDVCFGDPEGVKFWNLMRRLNFGIHYVAVGNHHSGILAAYKKVLRELFPQCFEGDKMVAEVYPLYTTIDGDPNKRLCFLPQYAELQLKCPHNTFCMVVCHYALRVWNGMSDGDFCLFGHSHGNLPDIPTMKTLDVGIEAFGGPISLADVQRKIGNRKFEPVDHHGT